MKIICLGDNYISKEQDKECNPVVFLKPDSAIIKDGKPFFLPDFSNDIRGEIEVVVRICRLGKHISPKYAHRYYDAITVGIDFTADDLLKEASEKGMPWETSKAFDGSAVLGKMQPLDNRDINNIDFSLSINGQRRQFGNTKDLYKKVDMAIAEISKFMTLKIGDLLFTGAPMAADKVNINDHLEGYIGEEKLLELNIK